MRLSPKPPPLPIDALVDDMRTLLQRGPNLVVEAPPGAGKTTGLPPVLLGEKLSGEIWVMQPRRIAARMAATRVASNLGETAGERCGFQVRFEKVAGPKTQLRFVTEGVLLREITRNPTLKGIGTLIFDEVHERNLDGELGLVLARHIQQKQRPQLRIWAMSATLDAQRFAEFLAAPILRAEGRSFPVEISYQPANKRQAPRAPHEQLAREVSRAVQHLLAEERIGASHEHVLVFLPGAKEIRAAASALKSLAQAQGFRVLPLHSSLPRSEQDLALEPGIERKLILATNVAETSVTIDGVVAVIDSGLARVARDDPWSGLSQLELCSISQASATQRMGRAGRTRPGHCVRLCSRHEHERRRSEDAPELTRLDLSQTVLNLGQLGLRPDQIQWLEAPPESALTRAQSLLRRLGALDDSGTITSLGKELQRFPTHPRIGRFLVAAQERGVGRRGAWVAAALSEGPLRRRGQGRAHSAHADPIEEVVLLKRGRDESGLDPGAARTAKQVARQLERQCQDRAPTPAGDEIDDVLRECLLAAYPDRVARRRRAEDRDFVFSEGGSATLGPDSCVRESEWLVALRVGERKEGTHRRREITSAAAIEAEWLLDQFPDDLEDVDHFEFDRERQRVFGRSELRYGRLALTSSKAPAQGEAASLVLLDAARQAGPESFCDPDELQQLRDRCAFAHRVDKTFPELNEQVMDATLEELCYGRSSFAQLREAKLLLCVETKLGAEVSTRLRRLAPREMKLPGGRRLRIHYESPASGRDPWVASRLQDFFGLSQGPKIGDGRLPLVLHLRAPNNRDVQVTTDLAGFWERHYPPLRKTLMRRYPKHAWPEDPLTASPPKPGGRRRR